MNLHQMARNAAQEIVDDVWSRIEGSPHCCDEQIKQAQVERWSLLILRHMEGFPTAWLDWIGEDARVIVLPEGAVSTQPDKRH
jgi:hypothetical protein